MRSARSSRGLAERCFYAFLMLRCLHSRLCKHFSSFGYLCKKSGITDVLPIFFAHVCTPRRNFAEVSFCRRPQ